MILSNYVDIKISNNQIIYYKEKGYNVKGGNEIFSIKVEDLPNGSGMKIRVKCDICGKEKEITLNRYRINTKNLTTYYACSRKCSEQKTKDTVLKKYGVNNVSNSQIIKKKKVETCLKNFGVEYPQQSKEIFEKGKKTKLEKYGDENYANSEKAKITNLERYGVEYASQNNDIAIKTKESQFLSYKYTFDNGAYKSNLIKKYDNIFISYKNFGQYEFKCDCNKNHNFLIPYKLLWQRSNSNTILCTECNPISKNISGLETQLLSYIKDNYDGDIVYNSRSIISPLELDVYITDLKISFEFNGLFWHNELNKNQDYHLTKTEMCEQQGIQLIHVYEDDWIYKQDIIKSMILNKLNRIPNEILAKKCEIKTNINIKDIKNFLEQNHIEGYAGSNVKLGLFYKNELVSLMLFSNCSNNEYEIVRFCDKLNTNIIDGASKLFAYFIKNYNPFQIIAYSDRSNCQGELYQALGFELIKKIKPNYSYIICGLRYSRFNFRKDKLIKQGFDPTKTEREIMLERKIYRIYDSGTLKFIKLFN